ncbi:tRNA threonylcarbamoyladenosine dehydratase [Bacteroidia bacterium]|nr:tRNA threonylcarbamoyladenosine dehydratase [Bacteroidia bacterium]GHV43063.1 tRNA threonylcarbamoyladenosine dehydratase [Bacteroidia bacterium]
MGLEQGLFRRTELLLGNEAMQRIANVRVIIFGVGGVGSWCAESLVRSGIRRITLVDSDRICVTNINRQLMATYRTVGQVKVETLRQRLLEINPKAEITALQQIYSAETAASFHIETYDYIIDAIDSLGNKALLIKEACKTQAKFFSSMGAALKINPLRVQAAEFWKVQGCPLAAALRRKFKKSKDFPAKKFTCIFSDELLANKGRNESCGTEKCLCPKSEMKIGNHALVNHEWCSSKAQINGTTAHITAIFGFMLAGLVMQDVAENNEKCTN